MVNQLTYLLKSIHVIEKLIITTINRVRFSSIILIIALIGSIIFFIEPLMATVGHNGQDFNNHKSVQNQSLNEWVAGVADTSNHDSWFLNAQLPGVSSSGVVYAIARQGDDIYVGGNINGAGNQRSVGLVRYNMTDRKWHSMGNSGAQRVFAIFVHGDDLYVGGNYESMGGVTLRSLGRYNTREKTWHNIGAIFGSANTLGTVNSIELVDSTLFVGGTFVRAGLANARNIAKYDMRSGTWSSLGAGVNNEVNVIKSDGKEIYVGGRFTSVNDNNEIQRIARYNITSEEWSGLDGNPNQSVTDIEITDSDLYVAGLFSMIDGYDDIKGIARYHKNTNTWNSLGVELEIRSVRSLLLDNEKLYISYTLNPSSNQAVNNQLVVYDINDKTIESIGFGFAPNHPNTILLVDDNLFIGGSFTLADKMRVNGITRYNLTQDTWHTLGRGFNDFVKVILPVGDDLYLGGNFTSVDEKRANYLVRYNTVTESWHPLKSSIENPGFRPEGVIRTLGLVDSKIIVGGRFTTADGQTMNSIAMYNPADESWSPLGSGLERIICCSDPVAYDVVTWGNGFFVSGFFDRAGGESTGSLAYYDFNTGWQGVNKPVIGGVYFHKDEEQLFIAGAGNYQGSPRAARLENGIWYPLGVEVNHNLNAITKADDKLFLGGNFDPSNDFGLPDIVGYNLTESTVFNLGDSSGISTGPGHGVNTLLADGNKLYIGGNFSRIDDELLGFGNPSIAVYNITDNTFYHLGLLDLDITDWLSINRHIHSIIRHGEYYYAGGDFVSYNPSLPGVNFARWSPGSLVSVEQLSSDVPELFELDQNYPNPFNPSTTLRYRIPEATHVSLNVYDMLGRRVASLVSEPLAAGEYTAIFDGSRLASGIYLYRLQAGSRTIIRKMLLVK